MRRALLASLALASMLGAGSTLADPWHGGHGGYSHGHGGYSHGHGGYSHGYGYGHGYYRGYGYWGPRAFAYAPYAWWGPPVYGWWGWPLPPVVVREQTVVREEPVYVERPVASVPAGYWYYCQSAGAYYPDVATCAEPWIPVPPRLE